MECIHKLSYLNRILTELRNPIIKQERKYMLKKLFFAVDGLYSRRIYIFPNIIELFKRNGFKKSSLYFDAISYITKNIISKLKGNVEWITSRTLKKANTDEKNIIICFLLFFYRDYFIQFLNDFLIKNEENKENIKNLILSLKNMIIQASCLQPLNFSNKNASENEKIQKNRIITGKEMINVNITTFEDHEYSYNEILETENDDLGNRFDIDFDFDFNFNLN